MNLCNFAIPSDKHLSGFCLGFDIQVVNAYNSAGFNHLFKRDVYFCWEFDERYIKMGCNYGLNMEISELKKKQVLK